MIVTLCDRCGKEIEPTKVHIYADNKCMNPKNKFIVKRCTCVIGLEEDVVLCAECENKLNAFLNEFLKEED